MPSDFAPSRSSAARLLSILAAAGSVAVFAGCGDDTSSTGSGGSSGGGSQSSELASATTGEEIFDKAGCKSCHTLAAVGAEGSIGPNLDKVKPDAATVTEYVTNGEGSMPSFKGRLSDAQIKAVADYVSSVAGQ